MCSDSTCDARYSCATSFAPPPCSCKVCVGLFGKPLRDGALLARRLSHLVLVKALLQVQRRAVADLPVRHAVRPKIFAQLERNLAPGAHET